MKAQSAWCTLSTNDFIRATVKFSFRIFWNLDSYCHKFVEKHNIISQSPWMRKCDPWQGAHYWNQRPCCGSIVATATPSLHPAPSAGFRRGPALESRRLTDDSDIHSSNIDCFSTHRLHRGVARRFVIYRKLRYANVNGRNRSGRGEGGSG